MKKYREFWIDSLPIFNGDDIVSWKRAYTNEQDGFEKHKGNELYHVIEYSAYQELDRKLAISGSVISELSGLLEAQEEKNMKLRDKNKSLLEQCEKLAEALESLDKFAEHTRDHIFDVSECTSKGCLNGKNQSKDGHTRECKLLDRWNELVKPHQKTLAEYKKFKGEL